MKQTFSVRMQNDIPESLCNFIKCLNACLLVVKKCVDKAQMPLVVSTIKVKVTSQGHTLKVFNQRSSYTMFKVSIFHSSKVWAMVKVDDRHRGHSVQGPSHKPSSCTEIILLG